jgi:hypothetical protein
VTLLSGDNKTCTITNTYVIPTPPTPPNGTLHVIKEVVNSGGGTSSSTDFSIYVMTGSPAVNVSGSPAFGTSTPGTSYALSAGTYTISEDATTTYTQTFSADCPNGVVNLLSNDNKTCTVTNTYVIPTPPTPPTPPTSISSGGGYFVYEGIPAIKIVKTANPEKLPYGAGSVTYDYTVLNTGTMLLSNITVTDDTCSTVRYISGDVNNNSKLDINETWKYGCTMILTRTTMNTATVTGQANTSTVTSTATALVTVGTSTEALSSITPQVLGVSTTTTVLIPTLPNTGFDSTESSQKISPLLMVPIILSIFGIFMVLVTKKQVP